ncbi:MAG: PilZ domain-containing protein [Desulfobacterales bacterium]
MTPQSDDSPERRRYARIDSLNLTAIVPKEGDAPLSQVSMARTLDLSPAGARIEVHQKIDLGSRVELEIAVAEEITHVHGTVVHVEPTEPGGYLLGIEFDEAQSALKF